MRTVYILLGPKGSGKTYVGNLIEKKLGIKFISTEKIFLNLQKNRDVFDLSYMKDGYEAVEREIDKTLTTNVATAIESTGAFPFFGKFLKSLRNKYSVKIINLTSPYKVCMQRIQQRRKKNHIPMSAERIKKVYKASSALNYDFVLQIDTSKKTDKEITNSIKKVIKR